MRNFKTIKKVEDYLKRKHQVLTENTLNYEEFPDWDIRITAETKNNLVTTYTVKQNNTYNNDKICIEVKKLVDGQLVPSGIGAATSDFVILTFYDDKNIYMIKRSKLIEYAIAVKNVEKYTAWDKNNCQLAIFDRPRLLNKCKII